MPIIFIILLSACTSWLPEAHHIEIQQGNFITQTERDQLELGMSKEEVKEIIGKAILHDPYHPHRWDYIYTMKSEVKVNRVSRLTVYFEDEQLVAIDDSKFDPTR